jgi:hypothetical protein
VAINVTEATAKASDVIQALIRGMSTAKEMKRDTSTDKVPANKVPANKVEPLTTNNPKDRVGSVMRKSKREVDNVEE